MNFSLFQIKQTRRNRKLSIRKGSTTVLPTTKREKYELMRIWGYSKNYFCLIIHKIEREDIKELTKRKKQIPQMQSLLNEFEDIQLYFRGVLRICTSD